MRSFARWLAPLTILSACGSVSTRSSPGAQSLAGGGAFDVASVPGGFLVVSGAADGRTLVTQIPADGSAPSAARLLPLPPSEVTVLALAGGERGGLVTAPGGAHLLAVPVTVAGLPGQPIDTGLVAATGRPLATGDGRIVEGADRAIHLAASGLPDGSPIARSGVLHAIAAGDGEVLLFAVAPGGTLVEVRVATADLRSIGAPSGWPLLGPNAPYAITGLDASYANGTFLLLARTVRRDGGPADGPTVVAPFDDAGEGIAPPILLPTAGTRTIAPAADGLLIGTLGAEGAPDLTVDRLTTQPPSSPGAAARSGMERLLAVDPAIAPRRLRLAASDSVAALVTDVDPTGESPASGVFVRLLPLP